MVFRHARTTLSAGAFVSVSAVALALLVASPASATDFAVTSAADDGPGTLRQAILDANAAPGADVITIDPAVGTITLTSTLTVTDAVSIEGNGSTITRASAFDLMTIVLATPGAVSLDSLNFVADTAVWGRGVLASSVSPDALTITDSSFVGLRGGAVRVDVGSVAISGSRFERNTAGAPGGGVSVGTAVGDSVVALSVFDSNYSGAADAGGGGLAIETLSSDATFAVTQSYFVENMVGQSRWQSFRGIALHAGDVQGELIIDSSTFENHQILWSDSWRNLPSRGWSIGVGVVSTGGRVLVTNSTFDEPTFGEPSYDYSFGGEPNFELFVISAGTVQAGAQLEVEHSTIVGGGTLLVENNLGASSVSNTIAEGLTAINAIESRAGAPVAVSWSVLSTPLNQAFVTSGEGNQFDVADMMLQPLGDNGGPTPTMMIGPAGPAVGTGMPAALDSEPRLEQRGTGFPRRSGLLDVGAVELPGDLPTLPLPPDPTEPAQLAATGSGDESVALGVVAAGLLLLLGGILTPARGARQKRSHG